VAKFAAGHFLLAISNPNQACMHSRPLEDPECDDRVPSIIITHPDDDIVDDMSQPLGKIPRLEVVDRLAPRCELPVNSQPEEQRQIIVIDD
jgi:hypothetical protein